ncbi:MAG: hypothetical protein ACK5JH_13865 [Anaerocolumna sp.]
MKKKVIDVTSCAKEVAQILEKHSVTVGDMENVLNTVKDIILSSTPVHVE